MSLIADVNIDAEIALLCLNALAENVDKIRDLETELVDPPRFLQFLYSLAYNYFNFLIYLVFIFCFQGKFNI